MTMTFKWPALLAALAISAWLALWGDKTPSDSGVVEPLARNTAAAPGPETPPRVRAWVPRDADAARGWLLTPADPFRPLDAPASVAVAASGPGAVPEGALPLAVLGRGQVESGRETVFVQLGDEIQGLQIGSRVAGLQVTAILPDALLLRHLGSRDTLRIPLGAPHGVFQQVSPP